MTALAVVVSCRDNDSTELAPNRSTSTIETHQLQVKTLL